MKMHSNIDDRCNSDIIGYHIIGYIIGPILQCHLKKPGVSLVHVRIQVIIEELKRFTS